MSGNLEPVQDESIRPPRKTRGSRRMLAIITTTAVVSAATGALVQREHDQGTQEAKTSVAAAKRPPKGSKAALHTPEATPPPAHTTETAKPKPSLEVPPLKFEIAAKYLDSLVTVHTSIQSGYNLEGSDCTGSYLGNGVVATAAHCTRKASAPNGQAYSIFDTSNHDIRDRVWFTTPLGRDLDYSLESFFPTFDNGSNGYDVDVFQVNGIGQQMSHHLELAPSVPAVGSVVYMDSRFGDKQSQVYGGVVVEEPSNDNDGKLEVLYKVTSPHQVCIPGTSGTGVIDQFGRFVGVHVDATSPYRLEQQDIEYYGMSLNDVGALVQHCYIEPVDLVKSLLTSK